MRNDICSQKYADNSLYGSPLTVTGGMPGFIGLIIENGMVSN